ncbi:MAG: Small Multidrug Resistance protein [Candidatus Woesearchaeota archaeon]|nr:Small Multidrug Resistance protein [Candidatus Woesearchaeota archaeon]MDN5328083.1 Small Multidrug Resistance protein [Candidatus Woesearchaeota archaeon]
MNKLSIIFVIIATFLNAFAQMFYKMASETMFLNPLTWFNPYLITALGFYFVSALLIIYALKYEKLSLVYPVIATGFIWVAILSNFIFNEPLTFWKVSGILTIIFGIYVLNDDNFNLKLGSRSDKK